MKQLILISRINESEDGFDEFAKYSSDLNKLFIPLNNADTKFLLIKGSTLRDYTQNSEIAKEILSFVTVNGMKAINETIISWHNDTNINKAIEIAFGWGNLTVKEYSSKGNENNNLLYQNILNPLGEAIKNDNLEITSLLITKLWLFFSHDPILEAKLELLQAVLNGDLSKPLAPEILTDSFLTDIQTKYVELKAVQEIKNNEVFSDEFQNAFTKFRSALNLD